MCSNLYANGELAATPYETDKVLRHRKLCMGMNMEIQRQLVEYDRKNELELDAIILWELHTQLGLGPKRLKKFFDGFSDALNALVNRYEMDISDDFWLCTHKLKEIGVDVEDWYRQKE